MGFGAMQLGGPGVGDRRSIAAPIPGTSSEAHLRENVNAANLSLPVHARAARNAMGGLT
jgi:aryl-alcohol dehydrogenase-like predicted oxidoreductase